MAEHTRPTATRLAREISEDSSPEPTPKDIRFIDDKASEAGPSTKEALSIQA